MKSRAYLERVLKLNQFQEQVEETKVKFKENKKDPPGASYQKDPQNLPPELQDYLQ